MENGLHKPLTEGQGGHNYTPQGSFASLQGAGNDDLMWLLLERLMDFSMQCRHSANAYARSQTGQVGPILQELMTLLRVNGGGGYGGQYGGGFNNSFMTDKIGYLLSKLEQYENNYSMGPNSPQLPSAGPVLEILFQMLRNENNTPAKANAKQEYPEHIQKHLNELGDRMLKMNNVPSEGQTLDLLLSMLTNELETNKDINARLIQSKKKMIPLQKGSFTYMTYYNPGGQIPMSGPQGDSSDLSESFGIVEDDKKKTELQKMREELKETNKKESLWFMKKGYAALEKNEFKMAYDAFKKSFRNISMYDFNDEESYEIEQLSQDMMMKCEEVLKRKRESRKPWYRL